MPKIKVMKQNIRFNNDAGKVHMLRKDAALPYDLTDEELSHWFIQAHIKEGNIVVLQDMKGAVVIPVEDMTVPQLKKAILDISPETDLKSKKSDELIDMLKSLQLDKDKEA